MSEITGLLKELDPYGIYEIYNYLLPLVNVKVNHNGKALEFELPFDFIKLAREGQLEETVRKYSELGVFSPVEPFGWEDWLGYDVPGESCESPNGTMYRIGDDYIEIAKSYEGYWEWKFHVLKISNEAAVDLFGTQLESEWILEERSGMYATLAPLKEELTDFSLKWTERDSEDNLVSRTVSKGTLNNLFAWWFMVREPTTEEELMREIRSSLVGQILSCKYL